MEDYCRSLDERVFFLNQEGRNKGLEVEGLGRIVEVEMIGFVGGLDGGGGS